MKMQNWTNFMRQWTPKYEYEMWMTPHVAAIRDHNLTPGRVAWVAQCWPHRAGWTHDAAQNVIVLPPAVLAARATMLAKRQARKNPPVDYSPAAISARRLTFRKPGKFLERQQQIDLTLLSRAHFSLGWSMTDNLRRMAHPSARRLAAMGNEVSR